MELFKNIIIPVDFSDGTENAFNLALYIARGNDLKVHLLHVVSDPQVIDPLYTAEVLPQLDFEDIESELRKKIDDTYVKRAESVKDIDVIIAKGHPASEIASQAEELKADLIVMGTHGRSGLSHMLIGSVAERVIRTSPVPVLTVHLNHKIDLQRYSIKKILVPVDFSELSEMAFDRALQLGQNCNAHLDLLYAVQSITYYPFYLTDYYSEEGTVMKVSKEAERRLNDLVQNRGVGYKNIDCIVSGGEPYRVIIEKAEELGSDIIIMGTHGRKGIPHVVVGSVAERVSRIAECPVITVRSAINKTSD